MKTFNASAIQKPKMKNYFSVWMKTLNHAESEFIAEFTSVNYAKKFIRLYSTRFENCPVEFRIKVSDHKRKQIKRVNLSELNTGLLPY